MSASQLPFSPIFLSQMLIFGPGADNSACGAVQVPITQSGDRRSLQSRISSQRKMNCRNGSIRSGSTGRKTAGAREVVAECAGQVARLREDVVCRCELFDGDARCWIYTSDSGGIHSGNQDRGENCVSLTACLLGLALDAQIVECARRQVIWGRAYLLMVDGMQSDENKHESVGGAITRDGQIQYYAPGSFQGDWLNQVTVHRIFDWSDRSTTQ